MAAVAITAPGDLAVTLMGTSVPTYVSGTAYLNATPGISFTSSPFDSTGADLLVVFLGTHNETVLTVTDSFGNAWFPLVGPAYHVGTANFPMEAVVFYAPNATSGPGHTVTVGLSQAEPLVMSIAALSGASIYSPIDSYSLITGDNGTLAEYIASSPLATTQPNDLLLGFLKGFSYQTYTAGAGYTEQLASSGASLPEGNFSVETAPASSAGNYISTFTASIKDFWQTVLVAIAPTPNAAVLSWTASTGGTIANYYIQRCAGLNCNNFGPLATVSGTTLTYTDTTISAGTVYNYTVYAEDSSANVSPTSTVQTVSPIIPGVVSNVVATPAAQLSWDASWESGGGSIGQYSIERCPGLGCFGFSQIATTPGTSYTDTSAVAGTTYNYRIRALDINGFYGPYSAVATASIPAYFDNAADGGNNGGSGSSLTYSYTVGTNSNRLLLVNVVGDTSADDVSSVTYASAPLTLIAKVLTPGAQWHYLFYLLNPASGTNNVVVTAASSHYLWSEAASWYNVTQSGQPEAYTTATAPGVTLTNSVPASSNNAIVAESMWSYTGLIPYSGSAALVVDSAFESLGMFSSVPSPVTEAYPVYMTNTWGGQASASVIMASFFLASNGAPGITYDNSADGGNNGGSTASLTYPYTVGGGPNRLVVVNLIGDTSADDISSVTYAGTAMSLIGKVQASSNNWQYLYYLLNPGSGTANVVVTAGTSHFLASQAASWYNVQQSGQPDNSTTNTASATSTSVTTSLTTNATGSLVVQGLWSYGHLAAGLGASPIVTDTALDGAGIFASSGSPVSPAGNVSMTADSDGSLSTSVIMASFAPFIYVVSPTVASVSPTSGSTAGGTPVTITGTNFAAGATVMVGTASATNVAVVSGTTITATTPAGSAGAVTVTVMVSGQSASLTNGFTYVVAPTVSSVSPNSGTTLGGTAVTITGTNFAAGATVTFGGTAATNLVVVNNTTITATTPAGTAGVVTVTVTVGGQSGSLANGYTYVLGPTVSSVAPSSGSTAGGTAVTITGTTFAAGATVTFGGRAATNVVVVNSTTVTATTPAGTVGAVTVTVTVSGQSGSIANGFTYTGTVAISFIQVASATPQSPTATVPVSYPGAQTAGDLNVVVVGWSDTTATVQSVTDSAGNNYSLAIGPTSGTGLRQSIYYAPGIVGGSNTVTVTFSQAATFPDVRILEYRGVTALDVTAGARGSSASANSGAAATTSANELIFGANTVATGNKTVGSGFTKRIITSLDDDLAEDKMVTAAGSNSATATLTASGPWVMQMATFAAVSGPAPTVSNVAPSSGSTAGGTAVTITGTNFAAGATVTFGATVATNVVVVSGTQITATTPAVSAGAVTVTVTNAGGQSGNLASAFTYIVPPTVSSVAPNSGPAAGGTAVTITGANFATGATVTFGSTAATNVLVVNGSTITATTPLGRAGAVTVTVTSNGLSGSLASAFTYAAAPTVTSVSPASGSTAGGTAVTITGANFAPGATVTFGGTPATNVVVVSGMQITAAAPAGNAGAVTVTVTNVGSQSGSLANGYTYVLVPTVSSVTPHTGPAVGGTAVTITGTNFAAGAVVTFGGTSATNVVVVNSTTITATTPGGSAGAVTVTVTVNGQSATLTNGFTYVVAATVSSVSPNSGTTLGGTAVTITGMNFAAGATVTFGSTAATNIVVVSGTHITATTPAGSAGAVTVTVTNVGPQSGSLANGYTYVLVPTVSSVAPNSGPVAGGTAVTITGTDFAAGATVKFGATAATNVAVVNSTTITATTPAGGCWRCDGDGNGERPEWEYRKWVHLHRDGRNQFHPGGISHAAIPDGDGTGELSGSTDGGRPERGGGGVERHHGNSAVCDGQRGEQL